MLRRYNRCLVPNLVGARRGAREWVFDIWSNGILKIVETWLRDVAVLSFHDFNSSCPSLSRMHTRVAFPREMLTILKKRRKKKNDEVGGAGEG